MLISRIKNRISTKLLLVNLVGIVALTTFLTIFSISMIRSVFHMRYEDKLQTPGHIFLSQYTYKDILPYIDKLKEREGFEAESRQYFQDLQYALDMERTHADRNYPDEYHAAKERMDKYVEALSELKDDKYHTVKLRMLDLRVGAGLTHFFIFADLGIPEFYFHIFDAVFQGASTSSFSEDYGIPILKSMYHEAETVFATGEPLIALSSTRDEHNDRSYSFFSPIKDEYGSVVAVIGTDINMHSLETQLQSFLLSSVTIIFICSLLLLSSMYFALRMFIIKPILKLTAISSDIASGNIDNEIPAWIAARKDEMGILGKSYASMGNVLQQMLTKNDALLEAAISGHLDARSDSSTLDGFFAHVANKANDMLDIIGSDLDSIPSSLAILNADLEIVFTNVRFKNTFENLTTEAIYKTMLGVEEDEDAASLKKRLAAHLEQGEFSALVWFDLSEERRCLSFLCRQRAFRDGKSNGAVIVVTDATELVEAKDWALSANKAKSEFLSRVSHELRTPLNVILSMAKLGLSDKQQEESKERFGKIVSSSSHLSSIINDVLEMSRMESGKTEIKLEPLHLRTVANECVELLTQRAEESGIALVSSIDSNIPEVLIGDGFRIKQILINLLSNAIKFTVEGQVSLELTVTEQDANNCTVLFAAADTGIGMSEDFLQRIFTPFEQEDSYLSRRYDGSGLGLSISYNLTMLMGGEMTVESKLGEGSRFVFTIPFEIMQTDEEELVENISDGAALSLLGKRILLVDDIEINRIIISEIFADTGAEFDEAGDGEDAVEKLLQSPGGFYDCILMDIQMPKMDGYAATGAIRASDHPDRNIPIIAMTANALKEDIDDARSAGMNDHIAKPLDFDDCLSKVKKWCG